MCQAGDRETGGELEYRGTYYIPYSWVAREGGFLRQWEAAAQGRQGEGQPGVRAVSSRSSSVGLRQPQKKRKTPSSPQCLAFLSCWFPVI